MTTHLCSCGKPAENKATLKFEDDYNLIAYMTYPTDGAEHDEHDGQWMCEEHTKVFTDLFLFTVEGTEVRVATLARDEDGNELFDEDGRNIYNDATFIASDTLVIREGSLGTETLTTREGTVVLS